MPFIWGAAIGAVGGIASSVIGSDAASSAADAQTAATQAGIAQQNKQFEAIQKLLNPFVQAGTGALTGQQDLIGQNGAGAQQSAISAIQSSPQFAALQQAGNNNILQNASATGGLRGGNTQAALAQYSPQLLNQLIDQQYTRLAGLSSLGQNAAAGVGNAGISTGTNVSKLLQQQGAADAGNALSQGRAQAGIANSIAGGLGSYAGLGGFGSFGGSYTSPIFNNPAPAGAGTGIDPYGYLGGPATAGDFSDARLKKNIRRIGMSDKGNPLYEWEWKDGSGKARGVIAQEVAHVPGAVAVDPRSGFLTVDYGKV